MEDIETTTQFMARKMQATRLVSWVDRGRMSNSRINVGTTKSRLSKMPISCSRRGKCTTSSADTRVATIKATGRVTVRATAKVMANNRDTTKFKASPTTMA